MPGHFEQAKTGYPAELHARAVGLKRFPDAILDQALMLVRAHVDEIDDDQAADIPQPQLPGNFIGRFEIGGQRGFLDVGAASGAG